MAVDPWAFVNNSPVTVDGWLVWFAEVIVDAAEGRDLAVCQLRVTPPPRWEPPADPRAAITDVILRALVTVGHIGPANITVRVNRDSIDIGNGQFVAGLRRIVARVELGDVDVPAPPPRRAPVPPPLAPPPRGTRAITLEDE